MICTWLLFLFDLNSGKRSIRKLFFFPDVEAAGFQFGNEQLFLLARKSSNYEEAYINCTVHDSHNLLKFLCLQLQFRHSGESRNPVSFRGCRIKSGM